MIAMIGRKTNGGLVIMSSPLMPPPPPGRTPDACGVSPAAGVGDEVSIGDGVMPGVGVGTPCSVKLAHGCGCTLAQSLWTFGLSPRKGLTTLVNAPVSSATTEPATWVERSQYRVMLSFFKKSWPVTVMLVLGPPAVGWSPSDAPVGRGA